MKLPNGYGSVVKLTGNRRNPYAARVTSEWTPDGKQKYKYIGYYPTKKDALNALSGYHNGIVPAHATIGELWNVWSARKFDKISERTVKAYTAAYKHLEPLYNRNISDIKQIELQRLVDALTPNTAKTVVVVLRQLYRLAIANDYCNKDVAALLEVPTIDLSDKHKPFTECEIESLWKYYKKTGDAFAAVWLVLIYTGLRPGELLDRVPDEITPDFIDVTAAKNMSSIRRVPIPERVRPLIDALPPLPCSYWTAKKKMHAVLKAAGVPDHLPHDARHTFATRWKAAGLNPELCRSIMGHAGKDINESVYTHWAPYTVKKEMDKLN